MRRARGYRCRRWWVATCAALALTWLTPAVAQEAPVEADRASASAADDPEPEIAGVDVTEKLGGRVPLDLVFTDELGKRVRLGDYFEAGRPVLLTINYYRCPMLCTLVMNGAADALKQIDLDPGSDYQIVTVSIDPAETPSLAREKKEAYAEYVQTPYRGQADGEVPSTLTAEEMEAGWAFLTGEQASITALADATGFGFKWVESQKQYAHPAALILLSPDGTVTRYLYGIKFEPKTVRLSLVEAAEGKIGTTIDKILLTCFHFDPSTGNYELAMGVMRAGGVLTVLVILSGIGGLLYWERNRRAAGGAEGDTDEADAAHTRLGA